MEGEAEKFKLIKQGAEARLYLGTYLGKPTIVKERFSKTYRHPALDERLTKERTRNEVKGIMRAKQAGIRTPSIYMIHPTTSSIYMEYIDGYQTANSFISEAVKNHGTAESENEPLVRLADGIGTVIGKMHEAGIIHGDLTTSNVLIHRRLENNSNRGDEFTICLIDFGLSHIDNSAEDKGVDLYVLERAIISTYSNIEWFFSRILNSYLTQCVKTGSEVFGKLEEIRLRGRKRTMVG